MGKNKYSLEFLVLLANDILDILKKKSPPKASLRPGFLSSLKFYSVTPTGDIEAKNFDPIPINFSKRIEDDF